MSARPRPRSSQGEVSRRETVQRLDEREGELRHGHEEGGGQETRQAEVEEGNLEGPGLEGQREGRLRRTGPTRQRTIRGACNGWGCRDRCWRDHHPAGQHSLRKHLASELRN